MTEEQRIEDEALVLLVEKADYVILEYTGTRALLAPDTVGDIVRPHAGRAGGDQMTDWFYKWVAVWFQSWWYTYVFAPSKGDTPLLRLWWCRMRGHPAGTVFYNPGGSEPDYHCINCGDDLG